MKHITLGVVSQTPMVKLSKEGLSGTIFLSELGEEDYRYNVGGVTPLIKSQLEELLRKKAIRKATWFSLNPNAPKNIILSKRINAVSINLEEESSKNYVNFKEDIWNNLHGISSKPFTIAEYLGYFRYNSRLARMMLEEYQEVDLFEIHDFQQLLLGSMLGPSFPSILRWHIPFEPEILDKNIKKFIINGLEGNDAIIVSTRRALEGLIRAGYRGKAYQIYPHIDPKIWKAPTKSLEQRLSEGFGIKPDDFLVVNVARMDPMKSQDDLIRAISMIKEPKIKLMLVGGSSFSSSAKGLKHPKSHIWTKRLKSLVKKLKLEKRVIFGGSMDHHELEAAYSRANLMVLPSRSEGFGLVVVESWIYGVPAIVSSGAGISELMMDGISGYSFRPADVRDLALKIFKIYKNPKLSEEMGSNAHSMARACFVSSTVPLIKEVYEKTIEDFG